MNEEYRSGRSEFIVTMDFNERIPSTDSPCSNSTSLNIGYLYLKDIYAKLNLSDFLNQFLLTERSPTTVIKSVSFLPMQGFWILLVNMEHTINLIHTMRNLRLNTNI